MATADGVDAGGVRLGLAALRFFGARCSSTRRCALMPPKPKALTAARRGVLVPRGFHSRASDNTANGLSERAIPDAAFAKLAVAGRVLCLIARRVLIKPAAPAAVSMWPTLDLTEPNTHCPAVQPRSPHNA